MKKRPLLIAMSLLLAIAAVVIMSTSRRPYNWNIMNAPTSDGGNPYDLDLLDKLLGQSLPEGYDVCLLNKDIEPHLFYEICDADYGIVEAITNTPTDTSLMVVQYYPWYTADGTNISPMLQLTGFAQAGGTALLVLPRYIHDVRCLLKYLELDDDVKIVNDEYSYNGETAYTPKWYEPFYQATSLLTDGCDPIVTDGRICYNYFGYSDNLSFSVPDLNNDSGYKRLYIEPMLVDKHHTTTANALRLYFPESGGQLYIVLAGLAFTNLGMTTDGGHKIVCQMISRIDHNPVVRLHYPKVSNSDTSGEIDERSAILSQIQDNDTLSYVWSLLFVLALLVLSRGLMRRHPAVKGIEAEDIDRTDAMAVREHQFRKSPLLHFLYQCSWLYNGAKDYRELFDINYRRLARLINRTAGIELTTATDTGLRKAAEIFAQRQHRDAETIYDELKWVQSFGKIPDATVSPKQYKYCQTIIEKYKSI